ncbi:type III effector HrpK [Pseudomonas agarici]|uniref:type III effector HrpK domain-containing protein n=1 Tax=Pseudomonas agarici TaxID=46677 RepID=UPI0008C81012|nr:type III effector HrpK domain-containing protein [Pseudomonas agarici]NWC10641.1 type III effector HrpK [Pseudomonas agarici]SEL11878.1 Type III secretion system translocator protein, HrpF [Pseudomonas agarici]
MRISNTPFSGSGAPMSGADMSTEPSVDPSADPLKRASLQGFEFGAQFTCHTFGQHPPVNQADELQSMISQLLRRLLGGGNAKPEGQGPDKAPATAAQPAQAAGACQAAQALTAVPAARSDDCSPPAAAPSPEAAFLDDSKYSSPKELERWAPMVANLPPDQRLQAEKELNRPIAAARMALEKGPDGAKAMKFINDNPAIKTAIDTAKHGGKADGKITDGDLKAFAKKMQGAADSAAKDLAHYQKDHPDADPQSLQMVRSALLLKANAPLTAAADPHHGAGTEGETKINGETSADGLQALQKSNPGLSGALKQSAKTFSQPGFLNMLDQGGLSGRGLATHGPDKLFDAANIGDWVKKQAPTNGGEFASMLSDAATLNAVAGTDISKLGKDVFEQPQNYTGAQKAAVMVKLQQTQQSVVAGRDLHKTGKTEDALAEKIAQLQADPDVQAYMKQAVPSQERALVASDPALDKAVKGQLQQVTSGQALRNDMNTADRQAKGDSSKADYTGAITGLSAQLQMQQDLLGPQAQLPSAQQVIGGQPQVQAKLKQSYEANFSEGGALKQLLGQKKADVGDSVQTVDARKAAYDSVLPDDFVSARQDSYMNTTVDQLQQSKKGRELLEGMSDPGTDTDTAPSTSKAEQIKSGYDNTKSGLSAAKNGIETAGKMAGREASVGLGRMAVSIGGRIAGAIVGEAVGMGAVAAMGAAAGPVGWLVDAAMSLGLGIMAIIEAVRKHHAQKQFDHNVDPTLDQFGIPRAH